MSVFPSFTASRGKLSDVYNVYKGLIVLRNANPEAFNATEEDVNIDTAGYSKVVDVTSGTVSFLSTFLGSVRLTLNVPF